MNSGSTTAAKDKIAGQLLEAGLIDEDNLAKSRELQRKEGGSLGQALVKIGAAGTGTTPRQIKPPGVDGIDRRFDTGTS